MQSSARTRTLARPARRILKTTQGTILKEPEQGQTQEKQQEQEPEENLGHVQGPE